MIQISIHHPLEPICCQVFDDEKRIVYCNFTIHIQHTVTLFFSARFTELCKMTFPKKKLLPPEDPSFTWKLFLEACVVFFLWSPGAQLVRLLQQSLPYLAKLQHPDASLNEDVQESLHFFHLLLSWTCFFFQGGRHPITRNIYPPKKLTRRLKSEKGPFSKVKFRLPTPSKCSGDMLVCRGATKQKLTDPMAKTALPKSSKLGKFVTLKVLSWKKRSRRRMDGFDPQKVGNSPQDPPRFGRRKSPLLKDVIHANWGDDDRF